MSVASRRMLRVLLAVVSAMALMFTVAPVAAHAAGGVVDAAGSGLHGSAVLSDSGVGSIWVVAYRVTPDGDDWAAEQPTLENGSYDFPDLSAGRYVVKFSRGGYRSQCYGGATCTEVEVVDGQAAVLEPVALVLTTPGTIRGLVIGGDGKPLAGAAITARSDSVIRTTGTDANGAWSLAGMASDVGWSLTYTMTGRSPYREWVYPEEGVTTTLPRVVLVAPGSVVGTIRNAAGLGVPDAIVYLSSDIGDSLNLVTGPGGTYAFTPTPGRYRLYASAAGHPDTYYPGVQDYTDASLVSVKEFGEVTVDLTLADEVALTGRVTDDAGNPLEGEVALYRKDLGQIRSTSADTEGRYSFAGLWPSQFTVRASIAGHKETWLGGAATIAGATWVTSTSGNTTLSTIVPAVKAPITVTGTVRDTDGNPVQDVQVRLDDAYGAGTDTLGAFTMTGDEPGTYGVTVEAGDNQLCGDEAAACTPATITVPTVGATGVQISIPRFGSLSGTLALPDGVSIDWGEISLIDPSGHSVAYSEFSGTAPYSLGRVPSGPYELLAEAEGVAPFRASVTVNGDTEQDIALISGFSVSGVVTIPAGIGSVKVVALDAASGRRVAYDSFGTESGAPTYLLSHLPPGDYRIGAGYGDSRWEWYTSGTDPRTATPVPLVDASVTGINITLPTVKGMVRVSGQVILPTGIPVARAAGLDLWLQAAATENEYWPSIAADGAYSVDLPTGDYRLRLESDDQLMTTAVDEALVVTGPLTHDVTVPLGGMLTGRLVDADGLAADGWVGVSSDSSEGHTDYWGYWTFGPLAPGKQQLEIEADGFVPATAGPYTVVAGQSADTGVQRLVAAGRLPVRIPDTGNSLVNVLVTDQEGHTLASRNIWPGNTEWIEELPAGQVLVRFAGRQIVTEWWLDAVSAAASTSVTIKANASTAMLVPDLAVAAAPASGTITGKISNSTGLIGEMRVNVYGDDEGETATVTTAGTYSVQVPPGSYQLRASLCAGYWMGDSGCMGDQAVLWYPGSGAANAEWIDVASAQTTPDINVELGGPVAFLSSPTPVITGVVEVGATLSANPGAWAPTAQQLAYQWNRAGAVISGATGSTYSLTSADLTKAISVTVTATSAGRLPTARTSAPTASVVAGAITPGAVSVTGPATFGSTLTAVPGTWLPGNTTLSYQWLRSDSRIDGATATAYTLTAADVGKTITVTVTGTGTTQVPVARTSAPTASVAAGVITAGSVRVTGSATVGSTLTAAPGTWLPGATTLAYQWLRNGTRIEDATASTYVVQLADVASGLSVTVTGTKAGYADEAGTSAATPAVVALTLTSAPTPTISGTVKVGSILTVDAGAWTPAPVDLAYEWLRNGVAIGGATGKTHSLSGGDFATAMSVRVTGSKAGYASVQRTSAPTAKVASSTMKTVVPTVSGTLRVGAQLTAKTTGWVPGDARFSYKWFRSGKTIKGATAVTYALSAKDLGKTIKVTVAGSGTGYPSVSATSKSTKKVGKGAITTATPAISGTAKVGAKLTVQPGTWTPAGVTFSYQWYRSGKAISKAKSVMYTLTGSDRGKRVTVKVTGTKSAYTTASKTSAATTAVAAGDLTTGVPTITGKARVGQVLRAKAGKWAPGPVKVSFQWLRDGTAISKATRVSYKLTSADLGKQLSLRVTGTKAGYTTRSANSAPTGAVVA